MSYKQQFINDYEAQINKPTLIAVVVKLPTGAKEVIVNHEQIETKYEYYLNTYNENMELKHNNEVKILSWLFA